MLLHICNVLSQQFVLLDSMNNSMCSSEDSLRLAISLNLRKPAKPIKQIVTIRTSERDASLPVNLLTSCSKIAGVMGSFFWVRWAKMRNVHHKHFHIYIYIYNTHNYVVTWYDTYMGVVLWPPSPPCMDFFQHKILMCNGIIFPGAYAGPRVIVYNFAVHIITVEIKQLPSSWLSMLGV